jgi:hypothetical protein
MGAEIQEDGEKGVVSARQEAETKMGPHELSD